MDTPIRSLRRCLRHTFMAIKRSRKTFFQSTRDPHGSGFSTWPPLQRLGQSYDLAEHQFLFITFKARASERISCYCQYSISGSWIFPRLCFTEIGRVGNIESVNGIPLPPVVHYESVEAISTLNRIDFNLSGRLNSRGDSRFGWFNAV